MYATVEENNLLSVYAEKEDHCFKCALIDDCPLIAAVQKEVVVLRYEAINITNCALFEKIAFKNVPA